MISAAIVVRQSCETWPRIYARHWEGLSQIFPNK